MKSEYQLVALDLIDIPDTRLRQVKPHRVDTLAADISELELFQPVLLVAETNGRFTLDDGAHRTLAMRKLKRTEIGAMVTPAAWIKDQERRLREIMANIDREDLTKLERAEFLAEMKRVYEELHPDTKRGGDKGNQHTGGKKRQNEIFSFSHEAAARTGFDRRSIEIAVAISRNLTDASKTRARDTWLEDHQAGLKLLSEQSNEMQERLCDILFATPPQATSVGDALVIAEGRRLPTAADKLFLSVQNNFGRMTEKQRFSFLELHEQSVKNFAKEKGWL